MQMLDHTFDSESFWEKEQKGAHAKVICIICAALLPPSVCRLDDSIKGMQHARWNTRVLGDFM